MTAKPGPPAVLHVNDDMHTLHPDDAKPGATCPTCGWTLQVGQIADTRPDGWLACVRGHVDPLMARAAAAPDPAQRPDWDTYFLGLATAAAARADCTRSKVGAVVVDTATHRVLGVGYNGAPPGQPGCATAGACPRGLLGYDELPLDSPYRQGELGECIAIHAEVNAVDHVARQLGADALVRCTVYITRHPCPECLPYLQGRQVGRIVWPYDEQIIAAPARPTGS